LQIGSTTAVTVWEDKLKLLSKMGAIIIKHLIAS